MAVLRRSNKWTLDTPTTIQTTVYPRDTVSTEFVMLNKHGLLTIRRGFQFDGATWIPDRAKTVMHAALAHDSLYHLLRLDLLPREQQAQADETFYCLCLEHGVAKWRAKIYRAALKRFGHRALRKKSVYHHVQTADG